MDTYHTVATPSTGRYTVKMSRFLSFVYPVSTEEEARALIKKCQNEYHDARHVCWAYMLGPQRDTFQLNDNGEPSGTAGKPILGQINSLGLTDVLVCVVRYFGGIKLGTGGLIDAYRTAARIALDEAPKEERHATAEVEVACPYVSLNVVMGAVKTLAPEILSQDFDNLCTLRLRIRLDHLPRLKSTLSGHATLTEL